MQNCTDVYIKAGATKSLCSMKAVSIGLPLLMSFLACSAMAYLAELPNWFAVGVLGTVVTAVVAWPTDEW